MDKIYHGCRKRHPDGSHVVRGKDSNYFIPTTDSFWKGPHDIINAVKTRSQTEKQKVIDWRSMTNYFNKKRDMQNSI